MYIHGLIALATRLLVHPGACGIKTIIEVEKQGRTVIVKVESECSDVRAFASSLSSLTMDEALKPLGENRVYKEASSFIRHPSCPIPCAVLKAIEVELGLALKRDVKFIFCDRTGGDAFRHC